MVKRFRKHFKIFLMLTTIFQYTLPVYAQQSGGIRGIVYDKDFEAPLASAKVLIAETEETVETTSEGNFVFGKVDPGTYTLVFSKDGYVRQVKANVVVSAGKMTEIDIWLSGEFTEMEEFVVQDVQIGTGTEAALLDLRMESPALMDSISSELMSQAGASDAASALKLVAGATVQDGKYAVIRGLPDRYVNSQMNGVRLPTADADKRAVQLDQFPSSVIESIQVSKTFTPDQQGDASGGAVNVVLKGIPDERVLKLDGGMSFNSNVLGSDFFSYDDGDLNYFGRDTKEIQYDKLGSNWDGAAGVSDGDEPRDYKWSLSFGDKYEIDDDIKIGGFGSFFYERDSSFFDGGVDDKYWVENPGASMAPQYIQGTPAQDDFKTQLFDVTQASQEVKWGGLGSFGIETENHQLSMLYMYTRTAESKATLSEDTRGKRYYFPGYDVTDPTAPGNQVLDAAPYLRTETLDYRERTTSTLQFTGKHKLPEINLDIANILKFKAPELDWGISSNSASMYQPDKRQFGSAWYPESYNPGFPPWVPAFTTPEVHQPFKPAANFTMGNYQRIWKNITEDSEQWRLNFKIPFEQWTGDEGYFKIGWFDDQVVRNYEQESFSNFNDNSAEYEGSWEDYWSQYFPDENHPMTEANIDVDYEGIQHISAWYYMADIPLTSYLNIIGGYRFEKTELSIINFPESEVTWIPEGAIGAIDLNPGDADVEFKQSDILPSLGIVWKANDQFTFRGSYTETVARQTFKELTPIQQTEYLGGDVFIGNPALRMSALKNYDVRLDYVPYDGGLVSLSYFYKDILDPIEYVQRYADTVGSYTTPMNYPEGKLSGYEIEARQDLGRFWEKLEGLSLGANATFINSEVTLPDDEAADFELPNIMAPMKKRDMTNAPEHLYNIFLNYDVGPDTRLSLFYTVRGDTLIAGAGQSSGKYLPNVYETEYGTLNLGLSHKLNDTWKMKFQAKNLLDPEIETVYRSDYLDGDMTKTSYRRGMEFSISFTARF